MNIYLIGGFNPSEKYARQIGWSSPIFGVKIKNIWNHHLDLLFKNFFADCWILGVWLEKSHSPKKSQVWISFRFLFDSGEYKFTTSSHEKKWIPPSPLELDPLIPGNPFHVTKFWLPKPNPKKKKRKKTETPSTETQTSRFRRRKRLRGVVHLILKHLISFLQAFHDTLVRVHLLRFCENFEILEVPRHQEVVFWVRSSYGYKIFIIRKKIQNLQVILNFSQVFPIAICR